MPKPKPTEPTKIAYLFGAGATHAELQNIEPDLLKEKTSLLIKDVSSRVIDVARRDVSYIKDLEMVFLSAAKAPGVATIWPSSKAGCLLSCCIGKTPFCWFRFLLLSKGPALHGSKR